MMISDVPIVFTVPYD